MRHCHASGSDYFVDVDVDVADDRVDVLAPALLIACWLHQEALPLPDHLHWRHEKLGGGEGGRPIGYVDYSPCRSSW